jgi:hypothetical protein
LQAAGRWPAILPLLPGMTDGMEQSDQLLLDRAV